jgi:hypothetical protein
MGVIDPQLRELKGLPGASLTRAFWFQTNWTMASPSFLESRKISPQDSPTGAADVLVNPRFATDSAVR